MYTFDENAFSDLHKDAFGFRPGVNFWTWMETASDDDKQKEWDSLLKAMHQRMKEEHDEEQRCIKVFEDRIDNLMHSGTTREKVITWLMDAEDAMGDIEYFEFLVGIPYGYIKKNYKM